MTASWTIPVESASWREYELLDSGDGQKLERWGSTWVIRPEPKALWRKNQPAIWSKATAVCDQNEHWSRPFAGTTITWEHGVCFQLRTWQKSKHLGLFPEQEPHWRWIYANTQADDRLLNLFAYTGSASLVAAAAGARVTHLDASEPAVKAARLNAALSGQEDRPTRWIVEDVMTYLKREERRGNAYDSILLDPPSFGRGPKGQLWKIEAIADLIDQCKRVLSDSPRMVLLTMYNLEASALTLHNLMQPLLGKHQHFEVGELALMEKDGERFLPLSLYARILW